jgi:hypothetical protein
MTFSQLLGKSIDELEKMPVEELHSYLDPYLKVTRPELVDKTQYNSIKNRNTYSKKQVNEDDKIHNGQKKLIQQMLAAKGINIKL